MTAPRPPDHVARALRADRWHYLILWLIGGVVNLTLLAGPLYMMNVYDRVLSSRSGETLVALSLIAGLVIATGAVCDILRARLMHRLTARLQDRLQPLVFAAHLSSRPGATPWAGAQRHALGDLDALLRHRQSPALTALHDLPFASVFLGLLWLFHPALGVMACGAAAALVGGALLARAHGDAPHARATAALERAETQARAFARHAATLQGLGMTDAAARLWQEDRQTALAAQVQALDRGAGWNATLRGLRLLVQSAMLGLGAALVITDQTGGGVMIVSAILLGRALAPIEVVAAQWPQIRQARRAHLALCAQLAHGPQTPPMDLPPAGADLRFEAVCLRGADRMVLRDIALHLPAGQLLQVIGPSGAGKSALARLAAGITLPDHGRILRGGLPLGSTPAVTGYLSQDPALFAATIAANITRLAQTPDPQAVVAAAKAAGVHETVLSLPDGYDTWLGEDHPLSAGQLQGLALARAFYGDPPLLVLDQPEQALDTEGRAALAAALAGARARGAAVLHCTQDFAQAAQADLILCLAGGEIRIFGPREAVLRHLMQTRAAS